MLVVAAAILLLMMCWSFWGWSVGDSRNIRWIRHWCGGTFVLLLAVVSVGAGFLAGRIQERSAARRSIRAALQAIAIRIEAGDQQRVMRELRKLDCFTDADAPEQDIPEELLQLTARLNSSEPITSKQEFKDALRR